MNQINKSLIIGAGEVGKALHKVLGGDITDINILSEKYDIIHISFPYISEQFIEEVKRYQELYTPKYTIIHSTVPIGTSNKCNAIHSPVIGIHPYLEESLKTFIKFIGGKQAGEVADYFRRFGIKIYLCDKSETTELMKLLCTTKYGLDIEYTKDVKRQCDKYGIPFEIWTLWTDNYNKGYTKLGQEQFIRPNLIPNMQKIDGHCVMPNIELIDTFFTNILKELNG